MPVDVLSEVLATLGLSARPWFRAELRGDFGVAVPAGKDEDSDAIRFHVATGGACTLSAAGHAPVRFSAGDLVLVPHGAPHVLADAPGRTPVPLEALVGPGAIEGIAPLRHGERGDSTVLVCGELRFGHPATHPFVASLPPVLHASWGGRAGYGWIEPLLCHIEREMRTQPTGHLGVVQRLSEILLVEVLRAGLGREDDAGVSGCALGALTALTDPQIGRALEALHAEPEAEWSLDRLARVAGQSRTLFVERFRERLGQSPMKYLATWRMQKACRLLAESTCAVGEVARRVGYLSESAFNRTFREQFGVPPGAWRRRRLAA